MPANVELIEPLSCQPESLREQVDLLSRLLRVFGWTVLFSPDRWKHLANLRTMIARARQDLGRAREMASIVRQHHLGNAVHYDYWMVNSTLTLAQLRAAGLIRRLICRVHNYDLYDDRYSHCVPFRHYRAETIDAIVAISHDGQQYLRERLRPALHDKVVLDPLGVPLSRTRLSPCRQRGDPPLVVSVSRIDPVKRLHLLIDALAQLPFRVRWVHLGDGPERASVEARAAARLPTHVDWLLPGNLSNHEVLDFYASQPVSVLVNLSSAEGLPVSMMEAAAAGVPIVATDVGGVSEIVGATTGILLAPDASTDDITVAIGRAIHAEWDRPAIRNGALARFDAEVNFNRFAQRLLQAVE